MEPHNNLAPCLIGRGTVSNYRDMLRALETVESLDYRYVAHGDVVDEGSASLVKLMADPDSSTIVVNGCLFLNVASFRYLDFERADQEDHWRFTLHGDGAVLELLTVPDTRDSEEDRPHLLFQEELPDFESLILLDDEDDED